MMTPDTHTFVWCDLSAYRPAKARSFYSDLFGWSFYDPDSGGYSFAATGEQTIAGIFEMPPKFQKIGLPSFWMSYIHVEDVSASLEIAAANGGKVEINDGAFGADGSFGLVRDPLGAGFSLYSGPSLTADHAPHVAGARNGHSLHVSSIDRVSGFYEALFGWTFDRRSNGQSLILDSGGASVGHAYEESDEERGGFEYWAVEFAVDDLDASEAAVLRGGGSIFQRSTNLSGDFIAASDMDNAAFVLTKGRSA